MSLKTTRITVETDTFTVVRRAKVDLGWCPGCEGEVEVIRLGFESLADPLTGRQIQQWSETGKLHLSHSSDGSIQLCVHSLFSCFEIESGNQAANGRDDEVIRPRQKE